RSNNCCASARSRAKRPTRRASTRRSSTRSRTRASTRPAIRAPPRAPAAGALRYTVRMRRILVTSALPYANGPLHLGHIIEAVQTDIWVRLQRMLGHDCLYVCAEDAHGTPIMIRAQGEGVTPEALIERVAAEHVRDSA